MSELQIIMSTTIQASIFTNFMCSRMRSVATILRSAIFSLIGFELLGMSLPIFRFESELATFQRAPALLIASQFRTTSLTYHTYIIALPCSPLSCALKNYRHLFDSLKNICRQGREVVSPLLFFVRVLFVKMSAGESGKWLCRYYCHLYSGILPI